MKFLLFLLIIFSQLFTCFSSIDITSVDSRQENFSSLTLIWKSNQNSSNYNFSIYRDFELIGTSTNLNFTDNGIIPGEIYSYSFKIFNDSYQSDFSPIYEITALKDPRNFPLIGIDSFSYKGGFRISGGRYGSGTYHTTSYTSGRLAYNSDKNTMFYDSHAYLDGIGEFPIPTLVNSTDISDLKLSGAAIQNYVGLLGSKTDTGNLNNLDRLGGFYYHDGQVLVHAYENYDANQDTTQTSLVIRNASNLNGNIDGFYDLSGKTHIVSWTSEIPKEWQVILKHDLFVGSSSSMSINGRASMGPSAWGLYSEDIFDTNLTSGKITTVPYLDFTLNNIMANTSSGWIKFNNGWPDQYNLDLNPNALWTDVSSAWFGFIVPGSSTYAVIGNTGMLESGGGYKITQTNGNVCPGPCPYDPNDQDRFYWLFNASDFLEVKNGNKLKYEVKPYDWGVFPAPFENLGSRKLFKGGTYDYENNVLYLSMPEGDTIQSKYVNNPVILAFDVDVKNYSAPVNLNVLPTLESFSDTFINSTSISFEWSYSDNSEINNYLLFQDGVNILNTTFNNITLMDLSPDTEYSFSIQAYLNESVRSFMSSNLKIRTSAEPDMLAPSMPSSIVITVLNDSINISWDQSVDNNGVIHYSILRDDIMLNITNHTWFHDVYNLTKDTSYEYVIGVYDMELNFNSSLPVTVDYYLTVEEEEEQQSLSSGGGGPSSKSLSSSSSSSIFLLEEEEDVCISNFEYGPWSACILGLENRTKIDVNSCVAEIIQTRNCRLGSDFFDTIKLNSKKISLEKYKDNFYSSSFDSNTNYFNSNENLGDSFIVYNELESFDYLARQIENESGTYYYSLEAIDEDILNSEILYDLELLEKTTPQILEETITEVTSSRYFSNFLVIFSIFSFIIGVFGVIFHIKSYQKRKLINTLLSAKSSDDLSDKSYDTTEIKKYSKYISQIKAYMSSTPQKTSSQLREELRSVGWNSMILDIVFDKK
jgi:hypothetical protein